MFLEIKKKKMIKYQKISNYPEKPSKYFLVLFKR